MRIFGAVASIVFLTACSGSEPAGANTREVDVAEPATSGVVQPAKRTEQGKSATLSASADAAARFERSEPSLGTLVLEETGETFVLTLVAGGLPAGAATAADCAVTIAGPQDIEGVVRGRVVPSSGAYGDMTAADIGPTPLKVDVMIGPEGAFVTDHGAAAKLCGMGSQLDGFYKRLNTPD